jgi:hypothetical protein
MTVQEHARGVRRLVHDFNNLLFVIGGHCELLNAHCHASPQASADLAVVADAVARASTLTAELRAMAIAMADADAAATGSTEPRAAVR